MHGGWELEQLHRLHSMSQTSCQCYVGNRRSNRMGNLHLSPRVHSLHLYARRCHIYISVLSVIYNFNLVLIFWFYFWSEIRFLRHKIHLNLFLSLLTANLDWVLIYAVEHPDNTEILSTLNCILHVLLRYFHLTNFFWMFVEGVKVYVDVYEGWCFKSGLI